MADERLRDARTGASGVEASTAPAMLAADEEPDPTTRVNRSTAP